MPFSVQRDLFTLPGPLVGGRSLRDELNLPSSGGSVIDAAVPVIATRTWESFAATVLADRPQLSSPVLTAFGPIGIPLRPQRALARTQAANYDFATVPEAAEIFDELWGMVRAARALKARHKDEIQADIDHGYRLMAELAYGKDPSNFGGIVTFERVEDRNDERFVIFSDHHFTNFENMPNYFLENNLELYLRVLDHYRSTDYCLVEAGDVEDCILWEPRLDDATDLWNSTPWKGAPRVRPIDPEAGRWEDFLRLRYERRLRSLLDIEREFSGYYERIRDFRAVDRYVRLSGNHDTYTDNELERDLRRHVENLIDAPIHDVLRIHRGRHDDRDNISHVVMHGHQVDTACLQHGDVPWALTLGEVFSECLSWAFQGPDRFWKPFDARHWHVKDVPDPFSNRLATAKAATVVGTIMKGIADLDDDELEAVEFHWIATALAGTFQSLQTQGKEWFEVALGEEIAWEYFELDRAAEIFALEVLTGEDQWKLRHMAEDTLCDDYVAQLQRVHEEADDPRRPFPERVSELPKIVLGHTHEVRQNAAGADGRVSPNSSVYLNTGSAGRFSGLIWGVEIDGDDERIISWSETATGELRKIHWVPDGDRLVYSADLLEQGGPRRR